MSKNLPILPTLLLWVINEGADLGEDFYFVFVTSGYDESACDDYLAKTIDRQALLRMLGKYLLLEYFTILS